MMTPRRTAAPIALALCLAWPLATAQTTTPAKPAKPGATKSFGGSKPGGKLLTRDELRACMKMQADMKSGGATLERDKAELQREKAELQQAGEALKADSATAPRPLPRSRPRPTRMPSASRTSTPRTPSSPRWRRRKAAATAPIACAATWRRSMPT
jgi:hypothetical protein